MGEKYDLPHTATILIAVEYPEMVQSLLKRIEQEPQMQKFSQKEQYIYIGVQSALKEHRATGRVDMSGAPALLFTSR